MTQAAQRILLECSICTFQYSFPGVVHQFEAQAESRVPQVLSCGHTFCSVCLTAVARAGGLAAQHLACPTCRVQCRVSDIRTNFALREALEGTGAGAASAAPVPPPAEAASPVPVLHPDDTQVHISICRARPVESPAAGVRAGGMTAEETRVMAAAARQRNPGAAAAAAAAPETEDLLVSINPPAGSGRSPCDFCCVVDISRSMGNMAMVQDESGAYVEHGLMLLDVVRHALTTIIHVLAPADRLAIVAYNDKASTVVELTSMTEAGWAYAEDKMERLVPQGNTNTYLGLETGLQLLADGQQPGRHQHLLLLTDGIPNIAPPRGIVPQLKHFIKDKRGGRLGCTINTFGFGYDLDSQMLVDIANEGAGSYAFIPDAGFVGTVFVNAVTNLLVTVATNAVLRLEPLVDGGSGGVSLTKEAVVGGLSVKSAAGGLEVTLEPLQFGQTKDLLVRVPMAATAPHTGPLLRAGLVYRLRDGSERRDEKTVSFEELPEAQPRNRDQLCRLEFLTGVKKAMGRMELTRLEKAKKTVSEEDRLPEANELLDTTRQRLADLLAQSWFQDGSRTAEVIQEEDISEAAIKLVQEDLDGQVTEAFSRLDWYKKWGGHFLHSLLCAHRSQQCNNFKDPGVQTYGGELFRRLRDAADEVFVALDPPRPGRPPPPEPVRPGTAGIQAPPVYAPPPQAPIAVAPLDMRSYYNPSAG